LTVYYNEGLLCYTSVKAKYYPGNHQLQEEKTSSGQS